MLSIYLLSVAAATVSTLAHPAPRPQDPAPISDQPKAVFAHFIVGNAQGFSSDDWLSDITLAKQAHIDGFALNIAPQDADTILEAAYDAAASADDFKMFISFDYLSGGPWDADRVAAKINMYKSHPAQFLFNGQALVSTFEGVDNIGDWSGIKYLTNCALIPSWTSMGRSLNTYLDVIDGFFSWDIWPEGATDKNVSSDEMWIEMIGEKPYMMGISPWFYTNLPQWNKNWLWRGDDLWFQRWQQVIELQPALVEIVTWNDFGEAHYIGPIHDDSIPEGAQTYVDNMQHDSWRTLLPLYIDMYKSGNNLPGLGSSQAEKIMYWYRKNPSDSGSANGTTGNNPAQGQTILSPGEVSQDKVFISVLIKESSQINIQIGENQAETLPIGSTGLNHFSVPFNGRTGNVTITIIRDGCTILQTNGPAITDDCENGNVNWNALTGESS